MKKIVIIIVALLIIVGIVLIVLDTNKPEAQPPTEHFEEKECAKECESEEGCSKVKEEKDKEENKQK